MIRLILHLEWTYRVGSWDDIINTLKKIHRTNRTISGDPNVLFYKDGI